MSLSLMISPCPNDTFVFDGWVHGRVPGAPAVSVDYADVDVANGVAERGERDVVKVSYAALPWLVREYRVLPAGGALGRGCGPLVLARSADLDLARATVAVPGERTTAYLLFRLWSRPPARIVVMPFPQIMPAVRDGLVDAGLVIHEARFTYPSFGLVALADLGAWWEDETTLPIPLGAIVARRALDAAPLTAAIRGSLRQAWGDPERTLDYVMRHAQEMDPEVAKRHIATYVTEFTLDLGEEGHAAVRGLLTRAEAAGLVPPVDPLLVAP